MEKYFNKIKLETEYFDENGIEENVAVFTINNQSTFMLVDEMPKEDLEEYGKEILANFKVIPLFMWIFQSKKEFEDQMIEIKTHQNTKEFLEQMKYRPYPILKADDYLSLYGNDEFDAEIIPEAFITGEFIAVEDNGSNVDIKIKSNNLIFEISEDKKGIKQIPKVGEIFYGEFELHTEIKMIEK